MGLPQLGGYPQIVITLGWDELAGGDLHPVFRLRDAGRVLAIDPKSQWRTPDEVGHESHSGPVEGEQEGARTLQSLFGDYGPVGRGVKLALHRSIGPEDSNVVDVRVISHAKMEDRPGDHLLL